MEAPTPNTSTLPDLVDAFGRLIADVDLLRADLREWGRLQELETLSDGTLLEVRAALCAGRDRLRDDLAARRRAGELRQYLGSVDAAVAVVELRGMYDSAAEAAREIREALRP